MADEDLGTGRITIELDDDGLTPALNRLSDKIERALSDAARDGARRMQRQLNAAVRKISPIQIEVTANTRRFRAAIDRLNDLENLGIGIRPEVDALRFRREAQRRLNSIYVRIKVRPDFDEFDDRVRSHRAPAIDVRVNPNVDSRNLAKASKAISKVLSAVGTGAKFTGITLAIGALGIAAANAAVGVGALVAALAPAAGIIAAGPAAVLGFASALGALKIALSGVGDAFGAALSGDQQKFDKAIKDLSPAAQAAAKEVKALKPQIDKLRKSVQDSFFKAFEGEITASAKALSGPLTTGLSNIATAWGLALRSALGYIRSTRGVANITSILQGASSVVSGLALGTRNLTAGFLQAADSVSKAFSVRLGLAIQSVSNRFGTFLQRASSDGRLVKWVEDALTVFKQLGALIGNIGGILQGIFTAAGSATGGFLANLVKVTQGFEDLVKSAQGQKTLASVFKTLGEVGSQLGPILKSIAPVIGSIASALRPIVMQLGPAIVGIFNALKPAIDALAPGVQTFVQQLTKGLDTISKSGALTAIGQAFSDVLEAVSPLLPLIGQLAASLGLILGKALSNLAGLLKPVIEALSGALLPVLPQLTDMVLRLLTAFAPLQEVIGKGLAAAISLVGPLLSGLIPILEGITEGLVFVLGGVTDFINGTIGLFKSLLDDPPKSLDELVDRVSQAFSDMGERSATILFRFVFRVQTLFGQLKMAAVQQIQGMVVQVQIYLGNLVIQAQTTLGRYVIAVQQAFNDAKNRAIVGAVNLVASVVNTVASLPGRASAALGHLGSTLYSAGAALVQGFINGIRSRIPSVQGVLNGLTAKIPDWKGPKKKDKTLLTPAGRAIIQGLVTGFRMEIPAVQKQLADLTKVIQDFFKGKKTNRDDVLVSQVQATNRKLVQLINQRNAIVEKIKQASEFAASTTQGALQSFSLGRLAQRGDDTVGASFLTQQLKTAAAQINKFNAQVQALAKRGLRRDLIQQLIELGPENGAALANRLSQASAAQLKQLNAAQAALAASAKKFGQDSADRLFDAGKNAAKGFLTGLKSQQKDIENLMISIAKSLQKAIKNALGIHSPSRVLKAIGVNTMRGMVVGIDAMRRAVTTASNAAAQAVVAPFGAGASFRAPVRAVNGLGNVFAPQATPASAEAARRASVPSSRTEITNNFTINEVGNGETTAHRVVNRLALVAGVL